jgi:peptidoglycan/xylan/chitin deacetylase (PgdA/CDA1 family)
MDTREVGGFLDDVGAAAVRGAAAAISGVVGAEVITDVSTARPLVALTVDDGPHPDTTPPLLEALGDADARATFFLIGSRVERHPALAARIASRGHELGNHLMHDRPSVLLGDDDFTRELARTHDLLAGHGPVRFFRPGSGWFTPRMLRSGAALGYRCALGSADLVAGRYPEPAQVADRLAERCRPGSVIVLHEGTPARVGVTTVARRLLTRLAVRGLGVTTLSDLVDGDRP